MNQTVLSGHDSLVMKQTLHQISSLAKRNLSPTHPRLKELVAER